MVVGLFGWLDVHYKSNYGVIMDRTNPNREPFEWMSWDEFRTLQIIRNVFIHKFEGIIDDEKDLLDLQNCQEKITNKQITFEKTFQQEEAHQEFIQLNSFFI